nr:unnamed protein product [Callosobruchus chinensis]
MFYFLINKKFKSPNKYILSDRKSRGQFTTKMSDDDFTNYFRMTRKQFFEVHEMVRQDIKSHGCNAQKPIATEEKLAVFMRYVASGDSYKSIAYNYLMGDHTVSNIVQEVALAIWNNMQPIYLPEPTTKIWESIASRFEQRWQFPHCVGAVDGKHVVIKKPNKADRQTLTISIHSPLF